MHYLARNFQNISCLNIGSLGLGGGGATLSRSYRINTPAPLREVAAAVATRNLLRY